ncbi:MAG: CHASE2 domain-containing protein [Leptolyngbya sp. RL_3_1]|nr:CHASE2 domain-containing protein [Leptolyngbya sp. RL_3_1]
MVFRRFLDNPIIRAVSGTVLITSLLLAGGVVLARQLGVLQETELSNYGRFIRWRPDEGPDQRLLVVGIDENDIQSRQEDPLEDGTLADVLEVLQAAQARAIGIDIGRDLPQGPLEGRDRLLDIINGDLNIITTCLMSSPSFPGVPPPEGVSPDQVAFADFNVDEKGIVRRAMLFSVPGQPPTMPVGQHLCNDSEPEFDLPSLSMVLAQIYLAEAGVELTATESLELVFGDTLVPPILGRFGGYSTTELLPYEVMLNYRSAQNSVEIVSITDVLEGRVPEEMIRERIVLIGYTSLVTKDLFTTPYLAAQEHVREMQGVVVHAQATSQLLAAALDGRSLIWALPEGVEILLIWLWALIGGTLAFRIRHISLVWLVLGLTTAITWGGGYALFLTGAWLPVVPASISLVLCGFATTFVKQASRQGYTQALYELMRGQLQREADQDTEHEDYLSALVQRASTIRTGVAPPKAAATLDLNHPEMQTILAEVRAQAQADLAREREQQARVEPAEVPMNQGSRQKRKRLEALLARSQQVRQGLGTAATPAPGTTSPQSDLEAGSAE